MIRDGGVMILAGVAGVNIGCTASVRPGFSKVARVTVAVGKVGGGKSGSHRYPLPLVDLVWQGVAPWS